MALFVLLFLAIIAIPLLIGICLVVYLVFRMFVRSKPEKDFAAQQQATHHLLLELDALRSNNLISEPEHEERRKQIMDEFVSRTQIQTR